MQRIQGNTRKYRDIQKNIREYRIKWKLKGEMCVKGERDQQ